MAEELKEFKVEDVAKHNTNEDCWLILKDAEGIRKVYDVTKFLDDHPGGPEIILDLAGQDATDEFEDIGHSRDARAQLKDWEVGKIKGDVKVVKAAASTPSREKKTAQPGSSNAGPFVVASILIALVALFIKFGSNSQ